MNKLNGNQIWPQWFGIWSNFHAFAAFCRNSSEFFFCRTGPHIWLPFRPHLAPDCENAGLLFTSTNWQYYGGQLLLRFFNSSHIDRPSNKNKLSMFQRICHLGLQFVNSHRCRKVDLFNPSRGRSVKSLDLKHSFTHFKLLNYRVSHYLHWESREIVGIPVTEKMIFSKSDEISFERFAPWFSFTFLRVFLSILNEPIWNICLIFGKKKERRTKSDIYGTTINSSLFEFYWILLAKQRTLEMGAEERKAKSFLGRPTLFKSVRRRKKCDEFN